MHCVTKWWKPCVSAKHSKRKGWSWLMVCYSYTVVGDTNYLFFIQNCQWPGENWETYEFKSLVYKLTVVTVVPDVTSPLYTKIVTTSFGSCLCASTAIETLKRHVKHKRRLVVEAAWSFSGIHMSSNFPDSKVIGTNMGPIWGRQDPGGPYVGPMNFAILVNYHNVVKATTCS